MTRGEPAATALRRTGARTSSPAATTRLTLYGCGPAEAARFRETASRFGVLPTIVDAPVSPANAELAKGSRCVSVGHERAVGADTLRALSRVGVEHVSTRSVGCDHIDLETAAALELTVDTVSYSPDSVADYTLMLMLMVLRDAKSVVRGGDLHDYRLPRSRGRELRDLTVGVVGTGRIGTAVIHRLGGFGCRILTHDTRSTTAAHVPLDELVRRSDVVTLHLPLRPDTRHLLDQRRIALSKPSAVIVNTARGGLVDTDALLAALESGALGGAALDVVEGEEGTFYADCRAQPIDTRLARLQELPNVVLSPHAAFYTEHALEDVVVNTFVNCLRSGRSNNHG